MKACEGHIGRVFVLKLEDGDMVPACIERFAEEKGISVGHVVLVGGIKGGKMVSGPEDDDAVPATPVLIPIDSLHEVVGIGVLAPKANGKPVLHVHAALGRGGKGMAGCLRKKYELKTWRVIEAVLYEITGVDAARIWDEKSGLTLLELGD
ncbi:PPC domain-containing DNA-binding protein [Chloroflexota bacterium]